MPDKDICSILLDQNVPYVVTSWLRDHLHYWTVQHVKDLGFEGQSDHFLYRWAQQEKAIVINFDEDFADSRLYPLGQHYGVIRLRVWPTTIEKTIEALKSLLRQLPSEEWAGNLIIIDNQEIRVRKA
jgi:predicted nuclease of predicted toxin-antitoxin system